MMKNIQFQFKTTFGKLTVISAGIFFSGLSLTSWGSVLDSGAERREIPDSAIHGANMEMSGVKEFITPDMCAFAGALRTGIEKDLQLETWMVEEENFYRSIRLEGESEASLELESWMMNGDLFDAGQAKEKHSVEPYTEK